MSRVPQPKDATRPQVGNDAQVLSQVTATVVDAKETPDQKTAVPQTASKETPDSQAARFALDCQSAIVEATAKLLEQSAERSESAASDRNQRAIEAIDRAATSITGALSTLRSELAELAAGQTDSVREVARAVRSAGG